MESTVLGVLLLKQDTSCSWRGTACCKGPSPVLLFSVTASPARGALCNSQPHLPCASSNPSPGFLKSAPLGAKVCGFKQLVCNNRLLHQL